MLCTSSGILNSGSGSVDVAMNLVRKIVALDLEHASASSENDKAMISAQVKSELGSFGAMNLFVREKMHDILTRARGSTNSMFDSLFETLDEGMESARKVRDSVPAPAAVSGSWAKRPARRIWRERL